MPFQYINDDLFEDFEKTLKTIQDSYPKSLWNVHKKVRTPEPKVEELNPNVIVSPNKLRKKCYKFWPVSVAYSKSNHGLSNEPPSTKAI